MDGMFRFVGKNEVILPTDLCRSTVYHGFGGYSDTIDYDSIDDMNWSSVTAQLPGWIHKTGLDFEAFTKHPFTYEVIRRISTR